MSQNITQALPFSYACERNKQPILEVLQAFLQSLDSVLEVGSGTAQHAMHFARSNPQLTWYTSDQANAIAGINAQLAHAQIANIKPPFVLDVKQAQWCSAQRRYPAVYTANTLHIMNESEVQAFFNGLTEVTKPRAYLFVYGPFKYAGQFTSPSNADFDGDLRSRGCGSAIRDFEWIDQLAQRSGFRLRQDNAMPANNQCLIWQRD